jgi:hypothetical protein
MLRRLSLFAESLLQLANRYHLSGELIIVEWNPPSGPRLHEVLQLRTKSDTFIIRFIGVPPEAHQRFRNADVIPLFQYIAKNVGIRRARGEFVVATNPDLLFSDALVSFLASGTLDANALYRIDRHDVPANVPVDVSLEEQLAWCSANILRVHLQSGTLDLQSSYIHKLHYILREYGALRKAVRGFFRSIRFVRFCLAVPQGNARKWLLLPAIHTNASGDFTLLARHHWHSLHGYPELPIWSMHLDSLLCYMAIASGLHEQVLRPPARIFHLEHANSWVVMTYEERLRIFATKPWIDMQLLYEVWAHMYTTSRAICCNHENWGLGDMEFPEVAIQNGDQRVLQPSMSSIHKLVESGTGTGQ